MKLLFVALIGLVLFLGGTLGHQNNVTNSREHLLALRRACSQCKPDLLLSLLEIENISKSSLETIFLLHETVKKGYLDMTKILIGHYAFEQNRVCLILRECFVLLCENQNIQFIQFVMSEYPEAITDPVFDEALLQAIETGNIELITELTNFKTISPKAVFHVLRSAAKFGNIDAFKMVSGDYSKGSNVHTRASFIIACANGHEELMDWLIQTGVDPSTSRNEGLSTAVSNGHLSLIKKLLTFKSVIRSAERRWALINLRYSST